MLMRNIRRSQGKHPFDYRGSMPCCRRQEGHPEEEAIRIIVDSAGVIVRLLVLLPKCSLIKVHLAFA